MDINSVTLTGRLVAKPQLSEGKTSYSRFSIAVNRGFGDNRKTHFVDIVCFGKTAEAVCKYADKGYELKIEGSLSQSKWEKDGKKMSKLEVIAEGVYLPAKKAESSSDHGYQEPNATVNMDDYDDFPL